MLPLLFFLILLLFLTYTDLRTRLLPDAATLTTTALFTLYWLLQGNVYVLFHVVGAFFTSYLLYRFGVWAGGDVKLFTASAAVLPVAVHGVPFFLVLMVVSVLVSFVAALLYILLRVLSAPSLRERFFAAFAPVLGRVFGVSVFLSAFGPLGALASFLSPVFCFLSAVALFLAAGVQFVHIFFPLFAIALLFFLSSFRSEVFSREVDVDALAPGDVPAEFVTPDGRRVPVDIRSVVAFLRGELRSVVNPLNAGGITEEEIAALQKRVRRIRVRTTLPFTPSVLLAYLFILPLLI